MTPPGSKKQGFRSCMGTQSRRGARDFDIVLISNSWLLEQVESSLPPPALRHPPLVERAGGWVAAIHPRRLQCLGGACPGLRVGDSIPDAIFFGEGEGSVGRIASAVEGPRAAAEAGAPGAHRVGGGGPVAVGQPRVRREEGAGARRSTAAQRGAGAPILPGPEASTARLSITLGCPCLCSFCFEGHDRAPFREISAAALLAAARELKIATGADTLEVESFNFNTHSELAAAPGRAPPPFSQGEPHEPAGGHPRAHPGAARPGNRRGQAQLHPRHRGDQRPRAALPAQEPRGAGHPPGPAGPAWQEDPGDQALLPAHRPGEGGGLRRVLPFS